MNLRKSMFLVLVVMLLVGTFMMTGCSSEAPAEEPAAAVQETELEAPERVVRELFVLTRPQAANPNEYEIATHIVEGMNELGLNAVLKVMDWAQMADVVWYERDAWDMTGWQMTARPERLDPDEFTFNLFHSSTAESGYNFVGYNNPEYDALAEQQRVTVDKAERQALVKKTQEIIADEVGYLFSVNPQLSYVFNKDVFDADSVVELSGLGIKNFWTFVDIEPISDTKDIVVNSNEDIQSTNPFYISGTVDSWITELVWDRVMRMGPEGLPVPYAAESVEWLSDVEVEVVLRDDLYFHDGVQLTADDVKFSFEVPLLTDEAPMYSPFVKYIDSIEKTDEFTLVFTLNQPYAAFETSSLAKLNIVPMHIWEPIVEEYVNLDENLEFYPQDGDTVIGSGPFKYVAWKQGEEVILEANENHFDMPKVDKWVCKVVDNMEATLGMIQSGEINFLSSYNGDGSLLQQKVDESDNLEMVYSIDLGFRFFAANLRRAPFSDVEFRRALASVIDRDYITQVIYKGYAVEGDSIISPALDYWKNAELNYPTGGMDAAVKILEEAGYQWDKDGQLLYPEGQTEELAPAF